MRKTEGGKKTQEERRREWEDIHQQDKQNKTVPWANGMNLFTLKCCKGKNPKVHKDTLDARRIEVLECVKPDDIVT